MSSVLRRALEDYLTMRRALGFKLVSMGYELRHFLTFMEERHATVITTELALAWVQAAQVTLPERARRLSYVRSFARHWNAVDPRTEVPPEGLLPYRYIRVRPYIYSEQELSRILSAALRLKPRAGLRPWSYYTLYGLMAVTGMRVGEAVRLNCDDVDLGQGLLTVRWTKFNKSRLIPLHVSTVKELTRYSERRDRLHPSPASLRFFLSNQGHTLTDCMVRWTFIKLLRQIGLRRIGVGTGPRLHDLRHRFAVITLRDWYRQGADVEQRLPTLSTYLGHAHVTDTYWYLTGVPELLALTKDRLERRWEALP